jgi:hypothetical protein
MTLKIRRPSRWLIAAGLLLATGVLGSCQNQRSGATFYVRPQGQALNVNGPYRHELSGMEFPTALGEFTRVRLLQYDRAGRTVSGTYVIDGAASRLTATVFIYPARDVAKQAQGEQCRGQFDSAQADLQKTYPGARFDGGGDATLTQAGQTRTGRKSQFAYDEKIPSGSWPSTAEVYLFCYIADQWQIEYRFTHPRELDAQGIIDDFMARMIQTLRVV